MEKSNDINSESFKNFILNDEAKRGYVICLKGEANTTLRSFFRGLFSILFTRRITSMSSYTNKPLRVIYNNYVDRINSGEIKQFPKESVEKCISELKHEYELESKKFLSQNTSKLVMRVRVLQRASCYLDALNKGYRNDDLVDGAIKRFSNTDNTVRSGFKGAFEGFFGGLFWYAIGFFILIAILSIIVFTVEHF